MSSPRAMIPYGRQSIDDSDVDAVVEVLRSDWLTTGPKIAEFETEFARIVGAKHAVAVCNGTAALHAATYAAGIGAGDEVIVPPLTFAASANCVRYQNGTVIFADVREGTLLLDPRRVAEAASERTKAVVAVDYTGQPADLDELRSLCRERSWLLIEDAAHALGATCRGERVGSIADLTTFSLHPVKQITTGEGGVVTTNDDALAARLRLFRNHGISTDHRQREQQGSWFYEMVDLGYNYRITDFQCALGLSQLRRLPQWVERRRAIARRYDEAFRGEPLDLLQLEADRESSWHLYVVQLRLEELRADRAAVFAELRTRGVGVNVHYIPVHYHPYYQRLGWTRGSFPVAERAYERLLTLPLFPAMTDDDVAYVIGTVHDVLAGFAR
jgi:perosamine synthetase